MRRDFTLTTLTALYRTYRHAGFTPVTFQQAMQDPLPSKTLVLRHDVDCKPRNSLIVARLLRSHGMRGTFYFRIVPESFQPDVILDIASLGHEIGYHYEDLTICRGDVSEAARHFAKSLALLRQFYPVTTICMHGSPLSRWDNRDLWKSLQYTDFGIVGEPYVDFALTDGLYLTDTGRSWNGDAFNIRDRIPSGRRHRFKTTFDIIDALEQRRVPPLIMQTFHPQRWTESYTEWARELLLQRIKNVAKAGLRRVRR